MTDYIETEYLNLGIQLQKSSGGRWRTRCPLSGHSDNDPSFVVYPDGSFHCYGCGAHGELKDIFEIFGKEYGNNLERIDLTTVQNKPVAFLYIRKKLEKLLKVALRSKKRETVFDVYDAFDRMLIDIGFTKSTGQLNTTIEMKRRFNAILGLCEQ